MEEVSLYTPVVVPVVDAVDVSEEERVAELQPLRTRPRAMGNRMDLFIGGIWLPLSCGPTDRVVSDRFAAAVPIGARVAPAICFSPAPRLVPRAH